MNWLERSKERAVNPVVAISLMMIAGGVIWYGFGQIVLAFVRAISA